MQSFALHAGEGKIFSMRPIIYKLNPSTKSSAPSINESAAYKTYSIRMSGCLLPFSFRIKDKTNGHHGYYE